MLYSEFTAIEMTIGSDIDNISGNTGFSFINVWSKLIPPIQNKTPYNYRADNCMAKNELCPEKSISPSILGLYYNIKKRYNQFVNECK